MLDGGSGSRITGGSGGRDRNCSEGSWREGRKRPVELGVDLPCVNKVKAVKVGQDVGRLLKYAMKLSEGNRSSMEESSLVGMRLHLEVQRRGSGS